MILLIGDCLSTANLKAVLMHNGGEIAPLVHVVRQRNILHHETYLRLIKWYRNCLGMKIGNLKHHCFLCNLISRDGDHNYYRKGWSKR